ncbi:LacI family DNA-binding transcriptional regulator [Youxingia wuxianensis]|uniref:LacI family DNA-binding transcriptional regulator n=1 Tax=Youxingia wuxianensis TaxID=2763678 RepID=A0A926IH95_9FIRM|nr:LacI family DNA-binding transcriptional regulator [Youxingia wuxianensis]MBC8584910.1 LacI family DNA-binding transcriptional regulator [Youxingia wuxianensis]
MKLDDKNKKISVTSKDVANYAKVSQATVSRVFSRQSYVKEETVKRVMDAARALGYTPNLIARSLNSRQTDLIAVVTVHFDNPFYQTLITKLSEMISALGKQMLFIQSPFESDLDEILDRVLQYQVDGVVVLSAAISSQMVDKFIQIKSPLVIFNKQFDSRYFFSVCSDNVDSGAMVAEFFVEQGYESFGYISGDMLKQTSGNRYKGYTQQLAKRGYHKCSVVNGDYSYQSGYEAILKMKKQEGGILPQAVFCANDLMAFGAMDAVRHELGLRIPQDVAFVGFDDLEQSSWEGYQLTSVAQPVDEMVEYTKNYLYKKLNSIETSGGYVLLKCNMVKRNSA